MTNIPQHEIIDRYLNKICSDRGFEKSPRNIRLLKFLVNKAIKGEDVNQYVIGLELFEQNYQPENNDSKVRVYMFNLRKKLEVYYENEGRHDSLVFKLDKGKYNLWFKEDLGKEASGNLVKEDAKKESVQKTVSKVWVYISFLLLIVLSFVVYKTASLKKTYCWNSFFAKGADNICIIADHVICWQPTPTNMEPRIVKEINSEADFIRYKEKHPNNSLRLANYSLYSKMAPFAVKTLNSWFVKHNSDFSMRQESRLNIEELRHNHVIYIGQFKTMTASKTIFLKDSKHFKTRFNPHGFVFSDEDKFFEYIPKNKGGFQIEYAMVSHVKLDTGKTALYFVSNNDIGVMATVNNFTNTHWLKDFYVQLPSNQTYFNALFEVSGLQRTEISCDLIHLEVVEY